VRFCTAQATNHHKESIICNTELSLNGCLCQSGCGALTDRTMKPSTVSQCQALSERIQKLAFLPDIFDDPSHHDKMTADLSKLYSAGHHPRPTVTVTLFFPLLPCTLSLLRQRPSYACSRPWLPRLQVTSMLPSDSESRWREGEGEGEGQGQGESEGGGQ
jgi:hypothetical protein